MTHWVPELLAPAGSLEKLMVAVNYGADAVYIGGQKFGLRSAARNFGEKEIFAGCEYAHERGSLVYVVLNSFLYDKEIDELGDFLKVLEKAKVDAVIVSDMGVVHYVKENSNLEVHLSTQASCLNVQAAKLWKKMGVSRIVLGREVSIKEAAKIKKEVGIELEMFVHGSMCMAYSGNCVISNYTQGRDSNRGGCAHSCRFEYSIDQGDQQKKYAYFMSSKDLQGIAQLQDFIDAGIDSLKVEGRMKSHNYAGTISKVYSQALSFYASNGHFLADDLKSWESELQKVGHRDYHSGSLVTPADESSIYDEREHVDSEVSACAFILEANEDNNVMLAQVRSPFELGDELEIVPFKDNSYTIKVDEIRDASGECFTKSRPGMLMRLPFKKGTEAMNIVRKIPNQLQVSS